MNETPGRSCPLRYRYGAAAIAQAPLRDAGVLYVVGGLYGNRQALDAIETMMLAEKQAVTLCFNGDFNWFDIDDADFRAINERVLRHNAIVGNVEAELCGDAQEAGCGCAYPANVADLVVERSNRIFERLRQTALRHPDLLERIGRLPMVARFDVAGTRIGVVHGDAHALAGWDFDVAALNNPALAPQHLEAFGQAGVEVFASTHTCLPALKTFTTAGAERAVINNGAAGMPNFRDQHFGVLTRIAAEPARSGVLYGRQLGSVYVQALRIDYDQPAWVQRFLAQWPPGSDAHSSYFERIRNGPGFSVAEAFPV